MKVVFFGTPAFAVPSLLATAENHDVRLVLSQPDRPAGRGRTLTPPPVKVAALERGLDVASPTKLRDPDLAEKLRALSPDVFVVVAYGRILPPALLDVPRLGPWNVHASLLPKYRGAAPIQWSIINGDDVTGVCVMKMEAGLDTGPVVTCQREAIGVNDTTGTLSDRLSKIGAEVLVGALRDIEAGRAVSKPQDDAHATLAPLLSKSDGELDFTRSARLVSCQARGVDPWPAASAHLDDQPIKVFSPTVVDSSGEPGEVISTTDGLVVACGSGAVKFAEIQFPGKKRMPATTALGGRPIAIGTRLGGTIKKGEVT